MANDQVQKIRKLLGEFGTAMLVTKGGDFAHARPMVIAEVEENCDLWFFTGRRSPKVNEIEGNPSVLIVCQDERKRYVSLRGRALLVSDPVKAKELWKSEYKAWFPNGPADPDLLLIHVEAQEAEYWDTTGINGLSYLFQAAKAIAGGTRPKIEEGKQHGKVLV